MSHLPRVGIDAHVLDGKPQGSATFLLQILKAVAHTSTPFQIVVFCENTDKIREMIGSSTFEYITIPATGSAARLLKSFPPALRDHNIDLGVFQFIAPPLNRIPSLLVVHDLLPYSHPDLFPLGFRLSRQLLFRHSILRAHGIVTVSETAKKEITTRFPALNVACTVASCSTSFTATQLFSTPIPPPPAPLLPGEPYILAVGRIEKRKNNDLLVRAFLHAQPQNVKLVIVGKQDMGYAWSPPSLESIIHLQNLTNAELLALFRNAALFVFPSQAEGFGIPLLDALLAGAATISSNQTAMPEVASGLALLFDPTLDQAEHALASLITAHFGDNPITAPTLEQRQDLLAKFSWEKSAQAFISALTTALQHPK